MSRLLRSPALYWKLPVAYWRVSAPKLLQWFLFRDEFRLISVTRTPPAAACAVAFIKMLRLGLDPRR